MSMRLCTGPNEEHAANYQFMADFWRLSASKQRIIMAVILEMIAQNQMEMQEQDK